MVVATVSLDDDVPLLALAVPVAALADETVPLLSLAAAPVGATPFCWAAVWKSVARNCWSAAVTESVEVDEVPDVLDVVSVELDDVLLLDAVADVLLSEPSPSDESAAAMAAASASMPDEPDVLDASLADSNASLEVESPLVLCTFELWFDAQMEYKEFESVSALIDM